VARRREIALRYDRELPPAIRPVPRDEGSPVHQYAVRHPRRDAIRAALAERGIETGIYYPAPLDRQPALSHYGRGPNPALGGLGKCPVADEICASIFALPVHEGLSDEEVSAVLAAAHEVT
jgi:dTDP-4-amino-4,6-dideoxygalactose transaminase